LIVPLKESKLEVFTSLKTKEGFYKDMAMAPHVTAIAAKVVPTVIALWCDIQIELR